jgi:hypothetical protein
MEKSTGNSELSVGVKILDFDHREMTEAIHEIGEALARDEDPRQTSSLLHRLAEFTLTHFALEEEMMAATKFPKMCRACQGACYPSRPGGLGSGSSFAEKPERAAHPSHSK